MQHGTRHLLKLESIGDCPRTNNGAHLIEMPDEGGQPWCVQCGVEFNKTEAELLRLVFDLRGLVYHCYIYSGHHNCGRHQMTGEQAQLYDKVTLPHA